MLAVERPLSSKIVANWAAYEDERKSHRSLDCWSPQSESSFLIISILTKVPLTQVPIVTLEIRTKAHLVC